MVREELAFSGDGHAPGGQLIVQTVNVRLQARSVDRAPLWCAHRRSARGVLALASFVRTRATNVTTYISSGVKSAFSRAWFHIFLRFPAPFFLLYSRAYGWTIFVPCMTRPSSRGDEGKEDRLP